MKSTKDNIKVGDYLIWKQNRTNFKKGDLVRIKDIVPLGPREHKDDQIVRIYHPHYTRTMGFFRYRFYKKKATKAQIVAAKLLGNLYE